MSYPKPWLASLLNFCFPGFGLLYLRRWKSALLNFGIVQVILIGLFFGFGESTLVEHIHYVFLALAAASAGYAHGVAQSDRHATPHPRETQTNTTRAPAATRLR